MKVSAYIPCFNNEQTIAAAIESILSQNYPVDELIIIDDGSTDNSTEIIQQFKVKLIKLKKNHGRGFVRNLATKECKNEFVLCCDATNSLASNFIDIALPFLVNNPTACSVSGTIKSLDKSGLVCRWRSRHLFKDYVIYRPNSINISSLITYGTLMKRSVILRLGNFDPLLKHSEDEDMADRINASNFHSYGHSDLEIICIKKNSLMQVFERYWRWNIGKEERLSLSAYLSGIKSSLKPMAQIDIEKKDYLAAILSLILPHYFLIKSITNIITKKHNRLN
jgi:glycosyltransferase involved in cell wall biosynthesis